MQTGPGLALARERTGRRTLTSALAAVTAVLALGSLPLAVGAATASITLKPSVGPPTTKVTVAGTGFGAGETVPVDFDATPVASATSSSSGYLNSITPFSTGEVIRMTSRTRPSPSSNRRLCLYFRVSAAKALR